MMGRRQKLKGGIEYDVIQKAPLCILQRSKIKKRIKSILNRRDRRKHKNEVTGMTLYLGSAES